MFIAPLGGRASSDHLPSLPPLACLLQVAQELMYNSDEAKNEA
jgi:hypothetical protein